MYFYFLQTKQATPPQATLFDQFSDKSVPALILLRNYHLQASDPINISLSYPPRGG
jgi:hypothetical protein